MWLRDVCDHCKYDYLFQHNLMIHAVIRVADSLAFNESSHTKHLKDKKTWSVHIYYMEVASFEFSNSV